MTRDEAIARDETSAIRDIPQSCICGDWQHVQQPSGWELVRRPRLGCPWHLSRERAG